MRSETRLFKRGSKAKKKCKKAMAALFFLLLTATSDAHPFRDNLPQPPGGSLCDMSRKTQVCKPEEEGPCLLKAELRNSRFPWFFRAQTRFVPGGSFDSCGSCFKVPAKPAALASVVEPVSGFGVRGRAW